MTSFDFPVTVELQTASVQQDTRTVLQSLARIEQKADQLKKSLRLDRSLRAQQASQALRGVARGANEASAATRGLTADQQALAQRVQRLQQIEQMRAALARGAAAERAAQEREVARATRETERAARRSAARLRQLRGIIGGLFVGFGAFAAARGFVTFGDAATDARNRLALYTDSVEQADRLQSQLLDTASQTRQSFEGTATVFSRLLATREQLNRTDQQLIGVTRTLNQIVAQSGSSATSANAALVQLSQGIAAGALRGEEFNSVAEQLPNLLRPIARELGVTTGELRGLARQGVITSDVIVRALENAAQSTEESFANAVPTIGQSFESLRTETIRFVDTFNQTTGASEKLARGILFVSQNIDVLANAVVALSSAFLVRFVGQAVPRVIAGFAAINAGALASVGAFAAAGGAIFIFTQRLSQLREDAAAIEQTFKELEADARVLDGVADSIGSARREINDIQRRAGDVGLSESQLARISELEARIEAATGKIKENTAAQRDNARVAEAKAAADTAAAEAVARQEALLEKITGAETTRQNTLADLKLLLDESKISQEQYNEAVKAGSLVEENTTVADRLTALRQRNEQLEIEANNIGVIRAAKLEDLRLRQQGAEFTEAERTQLAELIFTQNQLTERIKERNDAEREAAQTRDRAARDQQRSTQRREREAIREVASTQRRVDALRREIDGTIELRQELADLQQLRGQAPALIDQIDERIARIRERLAEPVPETGLERAFANIGAQADRLAQTVETDVVNAFANTATDAIIKFAETGAFSFKDFARSVVSDILRIITRLLVLQAIQAASSAFGGGSINVTARQGGGPVQQGQPVLVGERRPEIFVPPSNGTILPSTAQLGNQQAAAPVIINQFDPDMVANDINSNPNAQEAVVNIIRTSGQFQPAAGVGSA